MNCIVYPFSDSSVAVIKSLINNKDFNIKKLVTPKTWMKVNLGEKVDGGKFNFSSEVGAYVTNNFNEALDECDTVIIVDSRYSNIMKKDLIKKITYSIENSKNVICSVKLNNEELNNLKKISEEKKVVFNYIIKEENIYIDEPKIYKPDATIIGIGKIISRLDSSFTVIGCMEEYRKKGYKTAVITYNNNNLNLLGVYSYPQNFFDNTLSEWEKVVCFNKFIEKIDKEYVPDIIIIDIPDGMMRYSSTIHNGFGVMPFIISQAVDIDYFIFVTHIDMLDSAFYKEISTCFKYRFGYEIDAINVINMIIDPSDSNERHEAICNYVPMKLLKQYIDEDLKDSEIKVYNPQEQEQCEKMILESIDKLSEYSKVI